jgi:curved DNA-binding protein CbpA
MAGGAFFDHYKVLGVQPNATLANIRKAWRDKSLMLHPDRHASANEAQWERINRSQALVNVAWGILRDSRERQRFDYERRNYYHNLATQTGQTPHPSQTNPPHQASQPQPRPQSPAARERAKAQANSNNLRHERAFEYFRFFSFSSVSDGVAEAIKVKTNEQAECQKTFSLFEEYVNNLAVNPPQDAASSQKAREKVEQCEHILFTRIVAHERNVNELLTHLSNLPLCTKAGSLTTVRQIRDDIKTLSENLATLKERADHILNSTKQNSVRKDILSINAAKSGTESEPFELKSKFDQADTEPVANGTEYEDRAPEEVKPGVTEWRRQPASPNSPHGTIEQRQQRKGWPIQHRHLKSAFRQITKVRPASDDVVFQRKAQKHCIEQGDLSSSPRKYSISLDDARTHPLHNTHPGSGEQRRALNLRDRLQEVAANLPALRAEWEERLAKNAGKAAKRAVTEPHQQATTTSNKKRKVHHHMVDSDALFMEGWKAHRAQSPGFNRHRERCAHLGKRKEVKRDEEALSPPQKRMRMTPGLDRTEDSKNDLFLPGWYDHVESSPGFRLSFGWVGLTDHLFPRPPKW